MKRLLFIFVLAVGAFAVYAWLSGGTSSQTGVPLAPTVQTTPSGAPAKSAAPPPSPVRTPSPPRVFPAVRPTPDRRSLEVRGIISRCAQRAGWTITAYRQTAYGVSEVTGRAPNDNVRVQRFLDELQRSGILVDIETGPSRPLPGPGGQPYLETTFVIKWR